MQKSKLFIYIIIFGIIFLKPIQRVKAASITLSGGTPTSISDANQEYQIQVSLNIDSSDGTKYYMRGAFYKQGTTNYCGYTWNGVSWYNGPYTVSDGWKNLPNITISSSSATLSIKSKLDTNDNGCKESGTYNFKIMRYTESGSGTFDSQNEQTITVSLPQPTATTTPVPTNTPQPTNTPTQGPTNTPAPTATVTPPKATPTTFTSSIEDYGDIKKSSAEDKVSDLGTPTPMPTGEILSENQNKQKGGTSSLILLILIGGGALCVGASVILSMKRIRRRKRFTLDRFS
jgi:hypothetical protein